jgi:hypothetical protein
MPASIRSVGPLPSLRHIIGVLLALCLVGCSAVQLSYQNAPELTYWWLDSYLDINDAQSTKLRQGLTGLHAWHRQRELPVYLATLNKLQKVAGADSTPEQVCALYADLRARLLPVFNQFEPTAAALAPGLDNSQLDHLARQLDKRHKKWQHDWLSLSPEQSHAKRVKQLTERAEMFYGRLEEQQLAVLRTGLRAAPLDVTVMARESTRRQQDLLQTLRQLQTDKPGSASAKTALRKGFERWLESPDPAYRDYAQQTTQALCKTFAALHNASTAAQRAHFVQTLQDYRDDLRALLPGR